MYSRMMRMPSLHRIKGKTILHFACMYDGNGGSGGGGSELTWIAWLWYVQTSTDQDEDEERANV